MHEKLIIAADGSDGIMDIELLKSSIENSKVTNVKHQKFIS